MHQHPLTHTAILVLSFALLTTAHFALAWGLFTRKTPRWHGLLVLVPVVAWLAPYWGYRLGMKLRALAWAASFTAYVIALSLAL